MRLRTACLALALLSVGGFPEAPARAHAAVQFRATDNPAGQIAGHSGSLGLVRDVGRPGLGAEPGLGAGRPGVGAEPGAGAGRPGVGAEPGLGAGRPGVGAEPGLGAGAAGPGVREGTPMNRGGPVNRAGRR
jgi:hypothetical protein